MRNRLYLSIAAIAAASIFVAPSHAIAAPQPMLQPVTPEQNKANLDKLLMWVREMNQHMTNALNSMVGVEGLSERDEKDDALRRAKIARLKSQILLARTEIRKSLSGLESLRQFDLSFVPLLQRKGLEQTLSDNIAQLKNFELFVDRSESMILAIERGEKHVAAEFAEIVSETAVETLAFQAKSAQSTFLASPRNTSNNAVLETVAIAYDALADAARATHAFNFKKKFTPDSQKYRDMSARLTKAIARGKLQHKADVIGMRPILNAPDKAFAARLRNALAIQFEWFEYAESITAILDSLAKDIESGQMTQASWDKALNDLLVVETMYGDFSNRKIAALSGT